MKVIGPDIDPDKSSYSCVLFNFPTEIDPGSNNNSSSDVNSNSSNNRNNNNNNSNGNNKKVTMKATTATATPSTTTNNIVNNKKVTMKATTTATATLSTTTLSTIRKVSMKATTIMCSRDKCLFKALSPKISFLKKFCHLFSAQIPFRDCFLVETENYYPCSKPVFVKGSTAQDIFYSIRVD